MNKIKNILKRVADRASGNAYFLSQGEQFLQTYTPKDDDIVLWFENLEGARVLQDRINYVCLQLNNYFPEKTENTK